MVRHLPSIERLQAFLAVAKTGNFAVAAEELSLSQSAVSRQIAQLESLFDCRLFERHTRRIALTTEGTSLVPMAEQVINLLSDATQELKSVEKCISLRVHPTMATRWLIPRLTDLYRSHPGLAINMDTAYHRFPDFAFESIDAVFVFGTATWPDFETIELWEEELVHAIMFTYDTCGWGYGRYSEECTLIANPC